MDPLYDIYLTGKLAEGLTAADAGARLAQLFKAERATMTALLTGKPRLLKRGVDRATALKYRAALARIGVEVAFKAQAAAEPEIAAARTRGDWTLAPAGADVLKAEEKRPVAARDIDTTALSLAPAGTPLEEADPLPIAAPDVSHISVAAAGEDLLRQEEKSAPATATPAAGHWTLAPAGTPLENLPRFGADQTNAEAAPGWSLAPAGTELLSAGERHRDNPPAPNTDHLRVVSPR